MYEPKAIDFLTSNGKHILIYDYLDFPFTLMLASDIVIGLYPEQDEISLLIPDKKGVYDEITNIYCQKPTLGNIDLSIQAINLFKLSFMNKDSIETSFIDGKKEFHTLMTQFINQK